MICYLFEAPTYLIFAPDLPGLLYFSHIPTTVVALLVGFLVFFHNRKNVLNKLLFYICVSFAIWTFISLVAWTNINGDLIAFIWPFFGALTALISILSVYFMYVFINKHDVSNRLKVIFLALLAPVFLFAHTDLSVSGFDLLNCDAFMFEGIAYKVYYSAIGFLAIAWIAVLLFRSFGQVTPDQKEEILYVGVGIEAFLFLFNTLTFIVTYLTIIGFLEDSRLEMYGLFGMLIFMVFLAIAIIKYKTFNLGVFAAQALMVALIVLVGSQFTYVTTANGKILTSFTLVLTGALGIILLRNVKTEIKQREEIMLLAEKLGKANRRLKELDKLKSEFVSIASHQLRSPLTAIRGYSSMLLEGSFGKFPQKGREALERIEDTSKYMVNTIEDYLNVSRIESGNMKYEMKDFNLKDLTERVTDDLRREGIGKGLVLSYKSDVNSKGVVHADANKTEQILHNLINNALKYTQKGTVTVFVHDDKNSKKIYVEIIDTGIGMSQETLDGLFQKFERAKSETVAAIKGTGLGLFVAREMAKGMKGDITAHSEGEGKGSHFILELPLQL